MREFLEVFGIILVFVVMSIVVTLYSTELYRYLFQVECDVFMQVYLPSGKYECHKIEG